MDLTTLSLEKTDFLPSKYRSERRADLLWSIKTRQGHKILLHIEHQSTPDRLMVGRQLEYQAAIARHWLSHVGNIPPIFSLVVYHGARKWEGPKSIAEACRDGGLSMLDNLFQPFLRDLTKHSLDELEKHGRSSLAEMILATQPTRDMRSILKRVGPLLKNYETCCRKVAIEYMATVDKNSEEVFFEELSKFDQDSYKKYKTMFERAKKRFLSQGIQQGMQQGIQQGMQQGIQQGIAKGRQTQKKEIAEQMLKKGLDVKLVEELTGITKQQLLTT